MGASDGSSTLLQGSQFTLQRVKSYTDVIDSPDVLQPVIDELGLDTSVGALRGRVDAVSPADTVLIDISVTGEDPAEAAAVADAVTVRFAQVIEQLETPRDGGAFPVKVTVTVPAVEPSSPVTPRPMLNLVLGLALGLGLGAGLALLREQLDTSVRTADDIAAITAAGPLGMVRVDPQASRRPLLALDPNNANAEAYRTIRTNLQFVDVDNPPRRIVVTSAVQGEGKSTTAGNLAVTLAQGGLRVCVVDADLRRPRVAEVFGLEGAVGLSNVLAGQHDMEDVLVPWHDGMLTVLPAGTCPPNPSELLGSQHMQLLLAKLASSFDVLVIDSPPLLPVSDAVILAQATDGALLVVRHGSTGREQVAAAVASLAAVGAPLIGTVMTRVPKGRGRAARAYRYTPTPVRAPRAAVVAGPAPSPPPRPSCAPGPSLPSTSRRWTPCSRPTRSPGRTRPPRARTRRCTRTTPTSPSPSARSSAAEPPGSAPRAQPVDEVGHGRAQQGEHVVVARPRVLVGVRHVQRVDGGGPPQAGAERPRVGAGPPPSRGRRAASGRSPAGRPGCGRPAPQRPAPRPRAG